MKVVGIEAIPLRVAPPGEPYWGARTWGSSPAGGGYPPPARRRFAYSTTIDTVLVRLETSDGVVGWGECKAPVAATATAALVTELLAPMVVGTRIDEIAVTWDRMYAAMRVRGHDSGFWLEALSGVDIALWDAWSRTLGRPLHALLGGAFREVVPVYASGLPAAATPDGLADLRERAVALRAAGWTAVKMAIGVSPEADIASVRTVREVFDTVYADAAGQYDVYQALRVGRALEEFGVGFFEMPVPPENLAGYRTLAAKLDLPLALDSLATRHRALEFLSAGALHVLQPDVCRAGGITETMRIATIADAFGAIATPHVSIGSAVHFAASLSCATAIGNFEIMEHWIGDNPLAGIAADLNPPEGGLRAAPTGPGLGITVDEAHVRRLAAGPDGVTPRQT
jgi:D-galactarolactone cycloisomerase